MSKEACIFCQIVNSQIDTDIIYRDERMVAFRDVHPVAPTHVLIVPIQHIASLNELPPGEESLPADMLLVARKLAAQAQVDQSGYRLVINTGGDGGQSVFHLHLHLIGGRRMHWPPG